MFPITDRPNVRTPAQTPARRIQDKTKQNIKLNLKNNITTVYLHLKLQYDMRAQIKIWDLLLFRDLLKFLVL